MARDVSFDFDPFELTGRPRPKKRVRDALNEIADYVEKQVIESCGDGRSPVAGGQWKRSLSKEYKKRKVAKGGNGYADMVLEGDMLLATGVVRSGDGLKLRVKGAKQAAKADGHNNLSGDSKLPPREFIPKPDGTFRKDILAGIKDIIDKYQDDSNETE